MELFVIDTSSVNEIRRLIPVIDQRRVYKELGFLVDQGMLIYPKQVLGELEEYTGFVRGGQSSKPDLPYEWTKKNEAQATRFGFEPENLKTVLADKIVRRVVDPDKAGKEVTCPGS